MKELIFLKIVLLFVLLAQAGLFVYGVYQMQSQELFYVGLFNVIVNSIFGILNIKTIFFDRL